MGAEISLQRIPTKGEVQDKTETTIFLMNRILDFILRNADVTDMMSLATDEGCKKWIIVAESNLSKLFNRIRIQPELDKEGILYLRQVSSIEKESKKQGLNKQYCEILSFFFIRLFQVVGALSLSVLDTNLPLQDYMIDKKELAYEKKGVPFFKPVEEKKSFFSRVFGSRTTGGALTEGNKISGKYDFLNNYLTLINTNQYQLNSFSNATKNKDIPMPFYVSRNNDGTYKFEYTVGSTNITFDLELDDNRRNIVLNNLTLDGSRISIKFTETFSLKYPSGQVFISIKNTDFADYIQERIYVIRDLPKSQVVSILKVLKYLEREKGEFLVLKDTDIFLEKSSQKDDDPLFLFSKESKVGKKNIRFQFKVNLREEDNSYILKIGEIKMIDKNIYVDTSLEFNEVIFNKDKQDPFSKVEPLYNKQTIPKYLNNQMMKLFEQAEESLEYGIKKRKEGYVRPLTDIKVKDKFLKYTELWERLSSDKPVKSFCVARALQLLNLGGLDRVTPKSIKPMVFDTKFPLVVDKSLPSPGSPVFLTPSLKSLQTLYETPDNILKMSNSDMETRKLTLDKLLKAFNSEGKPFEEVFEEDGTLSETEIKNPQQISELRRVAIKLFQTQFEHSKKVKNLLKKIFTIDNSITLNSSILNKGVRGIEEVAVEARNLLTEYYSKCQTDYMVGINTLRNPTAQAINRTSNNKSTNLNNNNNNNNNSNNNNL